MAPSRRETRSRTSSPYAGRPESQNKASSQSGKGPVSYARHGQLPVVLPSDVRRCRQATPKTKQAQQEPSSRHRYGLRSMLSNLIWGSPVKAVEEESESGEEIDTDGDEDEDNHMSRLLSPRSDKQDVQVISDDEDEEEPQTQPSTASTFDSAPPRRFTAAEKGKGSPHRTDSYSAAKVGFACAQKEAFNYLPALRCDSTYLLHQALQVDCARRRLSGICDPSNGTLT